MKKVLLLMLMLSAVLTVSAQEGEWMSQTIQGDELKGTETTVAHYYIQEDMGVFVFWDNKNGFAISSHKMFKSTVSNGDTGSLAFVGLYDNDGNLKEKMEIWMILERGSDYKRLFAVETRNNPLVKGHKKNIKKILDAVRSGDGYVRILAGRYQTTDFDIKIPPFKE